jgi:hypothetical protein
MDKCIRNDALSVRWPHLLARRTLVAAQKESVIQYRLLHLHRLEYQLSVQFIALPWSLFDSGTFNLIRWAVAVVALIFVQTGKVTDQNGRIP